MGSGSSPPLLCSFPPTVTFTSFPTPDYWAVLLLLLASMFVYSSRGRWAFPPLLWGFPPFITLTSFPALGSWTHAPAPARVPPARPGLFTVLGRIPLPSLQSSGCPTLFATCLYCSYRLLLSFSFSLGGGRSVQGAMLIWPRVVCGSTTYCLPHLVRVFTSHLGMGDWWPGGPPGFSVLREMEILCAGWRCGGVKVFPLLGGLACKVCLQRFSKISLSYISLSGVESGNSKRQLQL
jgi:hypothetical protein